MCGIVGGWFGNDVVPDLGAALRGLLHRGPNDQGRALLKVDDGVVLLGHTRLSIIDLSAGGHQPMSTPDGRYTISFNGEIYNYREMRSQLAAEGWQFRSDSDTEVLLAAWALRGRSCIPELKGMFAFAVFDVTRRSLTCVRDAFGIKPLFYSRAADHFAFCSELEPLRRLLPRQPELNLQRAYDYLVNGAYDDSDASFLDGVLLLRPGHVLTVDVTTGCAVQEERWWWPDVTVRNDLSFDDAAEAVREAFLNNVRLHLRSDVALGAALSGGIDSSAVVCAMRQLEPDAPISTFSYVARGSSVDEEAWVDVINDRVGAVPHKVCAGPSDLAADLDDMIRAQGEPFGSTSIYAQYRVFRLAREHGITVTLDGQGADELLAGYHGFPGQRIQSLIDDGSILQAARFARGWSRWPGRTAAGAALAWGDQVVPTALRGRARALTGRHPAPGWLNVDVLREAGVRCEPLRPLEDARVPGRRVAGALRAALIQRGLPALLRHGDRNSMRWSIESRVPFLTTDFAELVLRLPESYLISQTGETKSVFRAAMRGIVPDRVLDRRDKIGFATPERDWLRALDSHVQEWLEAAADVPFLRVSEARQTVRRIADGREAFSFRAWRLVNYCRWLQLAAA